MQYQCQSQYDVCMGLHIMSRGYKHTINDISKQRAKALQEVWF